MYHVIFSSGTKEVRLIGGCQWRRPNAAGLNPGNRQLLPRFQIQLIQGPRSVDEPYFILGHQWTAETAGRLLGPPDEIRHKLAIRLRGDLDQTIRKDALFSGFFAAPIRRANHKLPIGNRNRGTRRIVGNVDQLPELLARFGIEPGKLSTRTA